MRKRILAFWPLAFLIVCVDWDVLDTFDLACLTALTLLCSYGAVSSRNAIRLAIGVSITVGIFLCLYSFGNTARNLVATSPPAATFGEGVNTFLSRIRPFRPYMAIGAMGLFAMMLNSRPVCSSSPTAISKQNKPAGAGTASPAAVLSGLSEPPSPTED